MRVRDQTRLEDRLSVYAEEVPIFLKRFLGNCERHHVDKEIAEAAAMETLKEVIGGFYEEPDGDGFEGSTD